MSRQAPTLTLRQLAFGYDSRSLLFDSFDMNMNPGERVALKGASGIGKSTLFQLILGFLRPVRGEILYRQTSWSPSIRKETAWLPQELSLGEGPVRDVLLRPFRFRFNEDRTPDERSLQSQLDRLHLEPHLLNQSWSMLSTGQKQRMGIVSVLLLDRPLLLLDEPTSALDEASKQAMAEQLLQDRDRTILSTSHDPWWLDHCDRIIELDNHFITGGDDGNH